MATQLDKKIEQLQSIVEKCFESYQVTAGSSFPADERPAQPYESTIELLKQSVR